MGRLDDALERDENLDLIPLILVPLLAQAGNNQDSFPAPSLELRQDELVARSDTSGPERFPDGLLTHPFELVRLRVQNDQLQMKSGEGAYQPLLADVAAASWLREGETLLHLDVQSSASGPGSGPLSRRQFPLLFFLPNLRPALFPL